jgi:SOS-response transcriptional repressor LexA
MKPQSLTREKILAFLAAQPYPPSIREIGDHVGLRSSSTVHSHLCKLKAAGLVEWRKSGLRTVRLTGKPECCPACGRAFEEAKSKPVADLKLRYMSDKGEVFGAVCEQQDGNWAAVLGAYDHARFFARETVAQGLTYTAAMNELAKAHKAEARHE